jgi:hypothetical protein
MQRQICVLFMCMRRKYRIAAIYSLQLLYTVVVRSTSNVLSLLIHRPVRIDMCSTESCFCLVRLLELPYKVVRRHKMYRSRLRWALAMLKLNR